MHILPILVNNIFFPGKYYPQILPKFLCSIITLGFNKIYDTHPVLRTHINYKDLNSVVGLHVK